MSETLPADHSLGFVSGFGSGFSLDSLRWEGSAVPGADGPVPTMVIGTVDGVTTFEL